MVSCPSWLRSLASPHHLVALLLLCATNLLIVTSLPPSSAIYLVRTDAANHSGDAAAPSTVWFSNTGYCTTTDDASSDIQCSGVVFGYDVESVLGRNSSTSGSASRSGAGPSSSESSTMSRVLTRGPAVLRPLATALSIVGVAAQRSILRRPRVATYVVAMGTGLLALLVTCVAFIFEHSLLTYIAAVGRLATIDRDATTTTTTTFSAADGPLANVMAWVLGLQLAACVVGFYTCIGGKYQCEGGIRLEEEDDDGEAGVVRHRASSSVVDEKCPL
ncbi:hypothetical protein F5Y14DRAFT_407107 [Nemania sp. NC0429]|nr:hypothetical protein F5Y14DRAFT_407107 [Nemania sp. NC0429]